MKMRCVGANDPPCKRCRNGGLECIQEKPVRGHPPPEAPSDEWVLKSKPKPSTGGTGKREID
jgi:hypothetical protein